MTNLKTYHNLDSNDSLAHFRKEFIHQENEIYLDGNSLGKLPKETEKKLNEVLIYQWGNRLIRSWNENWLDLPKKIAGKYSKLLNVKKNEVIIGESTSVRLYQIVYSLLLTDIYPKQLGTDILNFPTDNYILEGINKKFSLQNVNLIKYSQEIFADLNLLKDQIKRKPGIYCLSLVTYKSSFLYPMKDLNMWAEKFKSIIVWDLSHAIGAIDIDLKSSAAKICIGCSYKYMNGGPGAPAFMFIKNELQKKLFNPIQGWFGHKKPFNFDLNYIPDDGINRFSVGTPPVLSLFAMETGIDITLQAGIKSIRKKSLLQTEFFIKHLKNRLVPLGYNLESPQEKSKRGAHITISHKFSWQICQALIKGNNNGFKIIPDFRPPNFLRFGISPLYNRFEDLYIVIRRLEDIVASKEYLNFSTEKIKVT